MINEPWANVGITGEARFIELLYVPHSKSLVAQFYREVGHNHHVKSLYVRGIQDQTYRRLTEESDSISYEYAIVSPCGPFVLVNILEALRDEYGGYNWYALQLIELPGGKVVSEVKDGELSGKGGRGKTWVSKIHGMSQDGKTVYCTIGSPERSVSDSGRIKYHLAELDLNRKSFTVITELNGIFL